MMGEPFAKKLTGFGGMVPRMAETLLPEEGATLARNCRLLSGALQGFHQLQFTEDLNISPLYTEEETPQIAYPIGEDPSDYVWLPFKNRDTHLVKGPLTNDAYDRYYWTGDGEPKYNTEARIRAGDPALLLGIPAPINSPGITPAGGTPQTARAYVYTFVSSYGEEGPPCAPVVETGGEGTWILTGFDTTVPRLAERAPGQWKVRIYRTISGQDATRYYYVGEMDLGTASFNDTVSSDEVVLNTILESEDWEPPPADLDYLIVHPNGFLVGFVGTDVFMSVPYRPHAWPQEHVVSTEFAVVALGIFGQSVAVATRANPYILSGVEPLAMTFIKTRAVTPCLSRYGIVEFDYGVLFPSERGLVLVDGSRAQTVTDELIIGDQWKLNYKPEQILASIRYDEQYIAYYESDEGFIFSPQERSAWSLLDAFTNIGAFLHDRLTGKVHVLRSGVLYEWDAPAMPPVQFTWKSKNFDFRRFLNLGAVRIYIDPPGSNEGDTDAQNEARETHNAEVFAQAVSGAPAYGLASIGMSGFGTAHKFPNVSAAIPQRRNPYAGSPLITEGLGLNNDLTRFRVWADEKLVLDTLVNGEEICSLPSGMKAQRWQFEVTAYQRISNFAIGTSPEALGSA